VHVTVPPALVQFGFAITRMLNGVNGMGGENWYATSIPFIKKAGAVFAAFNSGSGSDPVNDPTDP
jgi:hypothetical protein